jgi:hypothetical protein
MHRSIQIGELNAAVVVDPNNLPWRGRPPSGHAASPAERMRGLREGRKAYEMKRSELEHLIRAAGNIAGATTFDQDRGASVL